LVAPCTNVAAEGRTLYGYDGEGRRVTKRTPDGTITKYIYDAMGALVAEYGGVATARWDDVGPD
jgi:YD repeat-containing protein